MQFDVYKNTDKETSKTYPYFVDIQTNLLDSLNSRAVIPLTPIKSAGKDYPKNLCPEIKLDNKNFALLTHQITSVPIGLLRKKAVSVESNRDEIITAIDFLVTGI
ncbi:MAG: CcdB family protein [Cellvibrionaceae bacterium]